MSPQLIKSMFLGKWLKRFSYNGEFVLPNFRSHSQIVLLSPPIWKIIEVWVSCLHVRGPVRQCVIPLINNSKFSDLTKVPIVI